MITQKELKKELNYDPETGEFIWISRASSCLKIGDIAGHIHQDEKVSGLCYRQITIKRKIYLAHRLAWFYVYGKWPDFEIDHIDGNGINNKIENIRSVSRAQNAKNLKRYKNNISGTTGVIWNKQSKKWMAYIKRKYLGLFDNLEDAVKCRKKAEVELKFHINHGRH